MRLPLFLLLVMIVHLVTRGLGAYLRQGAWRPFAATLVALAFAR